MKNQAKGLYGLISSGKEFPLAAVIAALSIGSYLAASAITYRNGFPLDDAWIHQTYARNLAYHFEWAYQPGDLSAGSTSPLWTFLLAPGCWLRLSPLIWAYFLGWIALAGLGMTGKNTIERLLPSSNWGWSAGILLMIEWHLVWAAASGMETLLFSWIALIVVGSLFSDKPTWLNLGLLVGLSVWLRPDGLTLLGPVFFVIVLNSMTWKDRLGTAFLFSLGFLCVIIPYLIFNYRLAETIWPNTFFAKQAEYAILLQTPIWQRFLRLLSLPLIGVGALLVPGFFLATFQAINKKNWKIIAAVCWVLGFIFLYTIRLPVTYQHGRYIIPVTPIYIIIGIYGLGSWIKPENTKMISRVVRKTWVLSCALTVFVFWFIGARAYGEDVAVIESEMVAAAQWIAANTEPNALIAAHDIGALGYFGNRRILDLAGLVSPQVIPFMRDEDKLAAYLDAEKTDYLMTFPEWYPELVKQAVPVFSTNGRFSPIVGGENMVIYRWKR